MKGEFDYLDEIKDKIDHLFTRFFLTGSRILGVFFYRILPSEFDREIRSRSKELFGHASMVISPQEHAKLLATTYE